MSACTFFGHRDTPKEIESILQTTMSELIVNENVNTFYVGNNGNFDYLVYNVLEKLKNKYPIRYYVVLAYMPTENNYSQNDILPVGIEEVPKKIAISYRNKWMIENSDYVVTYVRRSFGGANQFKEIAKKKNKKIIEL